MILKSKQFNIFTTFLSILEIKYTKLYANRLYDEHPFKDSLYGLSKMLLEYGVRSKGIKIEGINKKQILSVDSPFIAYYKGDFFIVEKITSDFIYLQKNNQKHKDNINLFIENWTGIALIIEDIDNAKEPDYKKNLFETCFETSIKLSLLTVVVVCCIYSYVSLSLYKNIGLSLSIIINSIGTYISYLLLLKQLHIQNQQADKICSIIKYYDCNNVLDDESAKLFGVISWSVVGLGYFVSNLLILFFIPSFITYLPLINIITLPYTVWSIWYQKFKIKQWCTLCVIVQGLLWIIFFINLSFKFIKISSFAFIDLVKVIIIYILPFSIIHLLIPLINNAKQNVTVRQKMNKLKMAPVVFNALLREKEEHYEVNKDTSKIILGNPDAQKMITVFTNPHCGPCASLHKRINKLLDKMGDKICIQYIFTSFGGEYEKSTLFLIAAYLNNSKESLQNIYDEWFLYKKYFKEEYFELYNYDLDSEGVKIEREKHKKWRDDSNLHFTPAILIDGYIFPTIYELEDLEYLL